MSTGMTDEKPKSKEERIRDLVKSMRAIEEAISPFKEQLSDIKKNYVENNWLSKDEVKLVLKASRLVKDEVDIDKLVEMHGKVKGA